MTPNDKVLTFLSNILEDLQRGPNATEVDRDALKDSLTRRSVQFATPRLRKECGSLVRAASSCENYLTANIETIQTAGEIEVADM